MKNALLCLILLVITSCSSKKANTNAKLEFVTGFSGVLGAISAGGALVHGVNQSTGETFTIFPNTNGEEISISSDTWSFHAFIWNGPNKLEGVIRCGKTTAELSGTDATVSLTLSQSACNDQSLIETSALNIDQALPIRFANCNDLTSITSGSDNCTSNLGNFGSYKISLLPIGEGSGTYAPLTSSCIEEGASSDGLTTSAIKVPFQAFAKDLFNLEVTAFPNSGCSGNPLSFNSNQGLNNLTANAKAFFNGTYSTIYLRDTTPSLTIGSLPYLAPRGAASLASSSYKTTIKIQSKATNKALGSSTNYKLILSNETYPEKAQQKVSTNYKMILGN